MKRLQLRRDCDSIAVRLLCNGIRAMVKSHL